MSTNGLSFHSNLLISSMVVIDVEEEALELVIGAEMKICELMMYSEQVIVELVTESE